MGVAKVLGVRGRLRASWNIEDRGIETWMKVAFFSRRGRGLTGWRGPPMQAVSSSWRDVTVRALTYGEETVTGRTEGGCKSPLSYFGGGARGAKATGRQVVLVVARLQTLGDLTGRGQG